MGRRGGLSSKKAGAIVNLSWCLAPGLLMSAAAASMPSKMGKKMTMAVMSSR